MGSGSREPALARLTSSNMSTRVSATNNTVSLLCLNMTTPALEKNAAHITAARICTISVVNPDLTDDPRAPQDEPSLGILGSQQPIEAIAPRYGRRSELDHVYDTSRVSQAAGCTGIADTL